MRKASVFPEPVFAAPRISEPLRARGMARDWIGVKLVKCADLRPSFVGAESGRSVKDS